MNQPETTLLEVWQRGPIQDVPDLLQPVAHALLQAREELNELMKDFPNDLLWEKPAHVASPAFHLQHLSGVLDRVFTYARNEILTIEQLAQLQSEDEIFIANLNTPELITRFDLQVDKALLQLKTTDLKTLIEARGVGRRLIPSTVIGLLVHAAEHTMRHLGQLMVTIRVIQASKKI